MDSDKILKSTGESFEYARIYLEQKADYLRLETARRLAKTTSDLTTILVLTFLSFMVVFFLTLSAGLFLGEILASNALGFLIITLIYSLLVVIIILLKRKLITNPITEVIVKNLLD